MILWCKLSGTMTGGTLAEWQELDGKAQREPLYKHQVTLVVENMHLPRFEFGKAS